MPYRSKTFKPKNQTKRARPSACAEGYGRKWQAIRLTALDRDRNICQMCGVFTGRSGHVDHIREKKQGGTDALNNLQTLCIACHNKKTTRARMARRTG